MPLTVSQGDLDAVVGMTFAAGDFANLSATLVDGTITNVPASPDEVVAYNGTTATVGAAFFPLSMQALTLDIVSVDDTGNTVTIDAHVGTSLVAEMDFTVVGFSAQGIALAAMPLPSLITQSGNLPGLTGSLFELGYGATGAAGTSVDFAIGGAYNMIAGAGVQYATAANPVLQGAGGPQMLYGLSGNDTITAGPGETLIYGGPGTNVLTAGAGTDTIIGTTGNDTIFGGSGPSVIAAGSGPSVVYAGSGTSVLIGGTGTDTFIFAPGHTGGPAAASADVIQNFSSALGDTINLSAFDAGLPASAGGHMTFIGTAAFDGHAGELRYDVTAAGVTVWGDTNGDGVADFAITLTQITSLVAHDFIL